MQYKNTEDGACILSCLLKKETCTNHSPVFIYDSIKSMNLINGLRTSKAASNVGGSVIKSNTWDEKFANKAKLLSVVHTIYSFPGPPSSFSRHQEPQQRCWLTVHGFHCNRLLSFMEIFGWLQSSSCRKRSGKRSVTFRLHFPLVTRAGYLLCRQSTALRVKSLPSPLRLQSWV